MAATRRLRGWPSQRRTALGLLAMRPRTRLPATLPTRSTTPSASLAAGGVTRACRRTSSTSHARWWKAPPVSRWSRSSATPGVRHRAASPPNKSPPWCSSSSRPMPRPSWAGPSPAPSSRCLPTSTTHSGRQPRTPAPLPGCRCYASSTSQPPPPLRTGWTSQPPTRPRRSARCSSSTLAEARSTCPSCRWREASSRSVPRAATRAWAGRTSTPPPRSSSRRSSCAPTQSAPWTLAAGAGSSRPPSAPSATSPLRPQPRWRSRPSRRVKTSR
mmetsp:Transcript_8774/g.28934  ORF Transcript_8774/g.28934 Transcript_8774/m.28934 type:complete len:272 (+) Transcript_8774:142-957(+)